MRNLFGFLLFSICFMNGFVAQFNSSNGTVETIDKMHVHIDLWYIKLISLDAESQLLSLNLELKMTWQDARLAWNPRDFDGIESIFVSSDALFIPDCSIGNAKSLDSVKPDEFMRFAHLFSNGTVYFPDFYYTEVACPIVIDTFPFDKQICPIPIMSIAFEASFLSTTAEIDPFLSLYSNKAYVDAMVKQMGNQVGSATITKAFIQWGNGEWDVTNVSTLNIVEAGMEVTFYLLNIRRVPNFYVYVIALPCFILTALSVVGMFWTRNIKKEQLVKLSIGLTSLVSMTVLLEMLSDSIPKTSVFPLLGIYVVCCVGIISLACVVITLNCLPNPNKHQDHQQQQNEKLSGKKCKLSEISSMEPLRPIFGIFHRHIGFLLFFQALNLAGFIVFLSFWD